MVPSMLCVGSIDPSGLLDHSHTFWFSKSLDQLSRSANRITKGIPCAF